MFHIRVVVQDREDIYLPTDVDLPLYITAVDEVLSYCQDGDGPQHIKVVLEWEYTLYKRWISRSRVNLTPVDDASVKHVKSESQHLSAESLDECFDVFTQQERLGASDRWFCPTCRRYQTGTIKSLSLSSLPEIMVVQLKRFKQDTENRVKLNALIQFPLYGLDMSHRMDSSVGINNNRATDEFIYDLYAVCNHFGNLQGGHYTAYCKNPLNDQWYNFDDHRVYKLRQEAVVTNSAYLLFYRRRLAQTHCAVSLQQWVSSVCSASYSNKTSDSVIQNPDLILHNQSADDGLVVGKTGKQSRTDDSKRVEHQRFVRQARDTRSVRSSRPVHPRTSSTTSLNYHQAALMQATLRMHRNPLPLLSMHSAVKQPTRALPVPSDWTTASSLRTRRLHDARYDREDSHIVPSRDVLHEASVGVESQKALLEPGGDVQEPLPSASVCPPSPPPVPVRQPRKPRRRTAADADNNNSLVDDADSRPSVSKEKESPNLSTVVPTNIHKKETVIDFVLTDNSAERCNLPTAAARRSLVFEKVPTDAGKTTVKPRRRATERHLPLQESSV